ncbi:hypothetical protein H312_01099 [Anncaliia algerae PRA339]|uniref:Uncharacterized protein n=1 Tax=Anncaliia algerae PRA339 TaxID=1288291 RepID=A0A059F3I8_9MICR|nr:hypothetical protein H312_01099 [Anncaliia algerae PRA339]
MKLIDVIITHEENEVIPNHNNFIINNNSSNEHSIISIELNIKKLNDSKRERNSFNESINDKNDLIESIFKLHKGFMKINIIIVDIHDSKNSSSNDDKCVLDLKNELPALDIRYNAFLSHNSKKIEENSIFMMQPNNMSKFDILANVAKFEEIKYSLKKKDSRRIKRNKK